MRVFVAGDERRDIVIDVFLNGLVDRYGKDKLYIIYRHDDNVGDITALWTRRNGMSRRSLNIEWHEKYDWELDEPDLVFLFGEKKDAYEGISEIPTFWVQKIT